MSYWSERERRWAQSYDVAIEASAWPWARRRRSPSTSFDRQDGSAWLASADGEQCYCVPRCYHFVNSHRLRTGTKLGTAVEVVGCIMEVRLAHQEYFSCTGSLGCINSRSCLCNQKACQLHSNNADDVSCLVVRNMFLLRKLFCY